MDPYNFDEDDYVESRDNEFSASFLEEMCHDHTSNEEFAGFTREEIYMAKNSRVRGFHERTTKDAEVNQEDVASDIQQVEKKSQSFSVSKVIIVFLFFHLIFGRVLVLILLRFYYGLSHISRPSVA